MSVFYFYDDLRTQ